MIRSSVDLPQPDGPMSETNSPRAMSRSMPDRAVVTTAPSRGERLVDAGEADDGRRLGSGAPSCGVRRGRPRRTTTSSRRMTAKNRMPTMADTKMAAHSFSGPVMYCWLKLRMARPRPSGMPPGPSPMMAPTMDAVAAIFKAVNRYGKDAGRRTLR